MKTEFKQVKRFVRNDESLALEKAVQSLGVPASQLEAAHEEKVFVFRIKQNANDDSKLYPFGLHTVERTRDENDLKNAIQSAKEHFKTFEGNIKRVPEKEDEQHFVFTKVRG